MSKQFIKCCSVTGEDNILYIDWPTEEFKLIGIDKCITYCPWCRILLDSNLPMDSED